MLKQGYFNLTSFAMESVHVGKEVFVILPWESNSGPTPIQGDHATIIVHVRLKKQLVELFK